MKGHLSKNELLILLRIGFNGNTDAMGIIRYSLEYVFPIFTGREAAIATKRDCSTIRMARIKNKLMSIKKNGKFMYSALEIDFWFSKKSRPLVNTNRWSSDELEELSETSTCKTRSYKACKIMKYRMKIKGKE